MLIGVFSDAHGHKRALRRAMQVLGREKVERVFFLGDAVGYFPSKGVLNWLMANSRKVASVKGNHEEMLLQNPAEIQNDNLYRLQAVREMLGEKELDFIKSMPISRELEVDGTSILFVHGTEQDPTEGYAYPDSHLELQSPYDVVFQGNTHWPMVRRHANTLYVNPGSCAMPRDVGRLGSVATFDTDSREVRILRYSLVREHKELLKEFPDTPAMISDLFLRTSDSFIGEMAD